MSWPGSIGSTTASIGLDAAGSILYATAHSHRLDALDAASMPILDTASTGLDSSTPGLSTRAGMHVVSPGRCRVDWTQPGGGPGSCCALQMCCIDLPCSIMVAFPIASRFHLKKPKRFVSEVGSTIESSGDRRCFGYAQVVGKHVAPSLVHMGIDENHHFTL